MRADDNPHAYDETEPDTTPDHDAPDDDTESGKPTRWGRRILAIILALALLAGVTVGAYLLYINHTVSSNVKREALLPSPSLGTDPEILKSEGKNILLIGSDARPGDTFSRSDVILIAHIQKDRKKVYLVHFPRDLYVDIPGHGKDKINASYAFGGAPLLVQTLQDRLRIRIDHVAKTDFDGFRNMTDAMGGVRVYAEEPSEGRTIEGEKISFVKGWNDLNGAQALSFVRERYQLSEGDISRGKRQQAFLKALMLKALSRDVITNPLTVAHLVDAATKNLTVDQDFTVGEMRSEALDLRGLRSGDIIFVTAPFTGYGTAPNGGSIDIVDEPGMDALGEALRTDGMGNYSGRVSTIP